MSTTLSDTTSPEIDRALIAARRAHGGPTAGHVLTLIVAADGHDHDPAIRATCRTAGEHPSRILVVRRHPGPRPARLDAEVYGGGERGPGDLVILDLLGELTEHAASVVLPLLVPDAPVVTYWPGDGPADPGADPLGVLGQRRITDLAAAADPLGLLRERAAHYRAGDTDLSWTRITAWRSLLTTALDQQTGLATAGYVAGEPASPSVELLGRWLEQRLGIVVERAETGGPGLTEVRLTFDDGEIVVRRTDGRLAMLSSPGQPERPIALKRRELSELMTEELRRLDPDEIYAECLATLADRPQ